MLKKFMTLVLGMVILFGATENVFANQIEDSKSDIDKVIEEYEDNLNSEDMEKAFYNMEKSYNTGKSKFEHESDINDDYISETYEYSEIIYSDEGSGLMAETSVSEIAVIEEEPLTVNIKGTVKTGEQALNEYDSTRAVLMRTTVYYYLDNDGGMQYYKYYKTKGSYAILNSSFSVKSQKVDMGCCGLRKDNGLYYSKTKTYAPTTSS